jgi:F0F1-type ATP synthase assembly protein I
VGAERSLPLFIVLLQLMTSLVMAAGLALVDNTLGFAAMLAGGACVLPAGYFAWRSMVERSSARLLGQGIMKSLATATLMALAFVAFRPAPLGFFATFALMQGMYVIGPLVFGRLRRLH